MVVIVILWVENQLKHLKQLVDLGAWTAVGWFMTRSISVACGCLWILFHHTSISYAPHNARVTKSRKSHPFLPQVQLCLGCGPNGPRVYQPLSLSQSWFSLRFDGFLSSSPFPSESSGSTNMQHCSMMYVALMFWNDLQHIRLKWSPPCALKNKISLFIHEIFGSYNASASLNFLPCHGISGLFHAIPKCVPSRLAASFYYNH